MSDEKENQAETIFFRVREVEDPVRREAFLDGACGNDPALRDAVESLLRADQKAAGYFDPRVNEEEDATLAEGMSEGPGTRIGRYKLLEQIGEGGMGVVYMAEQTEPFIKKVAIKIIKLGMDTKQVIARFEAERQALALMDHPNIAKVIDGGATEGRDSSRPELHRKGGTPAAQKHAPAAGVPPFQLSDPLVNPSPDGGDWRGAVPYGAGRPYFVMDLVRGIPITEYCDKQKLSTRERLELFIPVCQAIQHAHQKGIIHRDIKPNNVLVTLNDGVPHPMVIDFGIAKATNQKLTEKTLFTNFSQMLGTPAYMSPEQAEMSRLDVDTRSDIYSLGVMLYELLTDTTPFPDKTLRSLGWAEMQRIIVDEEPQKPSVRMSTLTDQQRTNLSKGRREEPGRIKLLLRRELDWIVMKCLEKDRNRRYATANGLAMDIRRYLDGGTPEAAPPTLGYQLGKMARRHRRAVVTSLCIGGILFVASIIATGLAVKATRAERLASAERDKAKEALDYFLGQFVEGTDPWAENTEPSVLLSLAEVLTRASEELDHRFASQPEVEALIRLSLGRALQSQGRPKEAIANLERALILNQIEYGTDHPTTLESQIQLGMVLSLDNAESEKVEALLLPGFQTLQDKFGLKSELTLRALTYLALHYASRFHYDLVEAMDLPGFIREAARIHGRDSPALFDLKQSLADLRSRQGRHADAREVYEELLEQERQARLRRGAGAPAHIREANLLRKIAFYQSWWDSDHSGAMASLEEAFQVSRNQVENAFPTLLIMEEIVDVSLRLDDLTSASQWSGEAFQIANERWDRNTVNALPERVNYFALVWSFVPLISGDWDEALHRVQEVRSLDVQSPQLLCQEILARALVGVEDGRTGLYSAFLREEFESVDPNANFEMALVLASQTPPPQHATGVLDFLAKASSQSTNGYNRVRSFLLDGARHYRTGDLTNAIAQLRVARNGTETPELTCLALYFEALAEHETGRNVAAGESLNQAEAMFGQLTLPGRMAYFRPYKPRFDLAIAVCEVLRREAWKSVAGTPPKVSISPETLGVRRTKFEPLAELIDEFALHDQQENYTNAYSVVRRLLAHPDYDFVASREYFRKGPRDFANHVLQTLAKADDMKNYQKVAAEYLAVLDPRLQSFHSGWVRHLDWMPPAIQKQIEDAIPMWAMASTGNWERYDLAAMLYVQGLYEQAYDILQRPLIDTDPRIVVNSSILGVQIASRLHRFSEASNHVAQVKSIIKKYRASKTGSAAPYVNAVGALRRLEIAEALMRRLQSGERIPSVGNEAVKTVQ